MSPPGRVVVLVRWLLGGEYARTRSRGSEHRVEVVKCMFRLTRRALIGTRVRGQVGQTQLSILDLQMFSWFWHVQTYTRPASLISLSFFFLFCVYLRTEVNACIRHIYHCCRFLGTICRGLLPIRYKQRACFSEKGAQVKSSQFRLMHCWVSIARFFNF